MRKPVSINRNHLFLRAYRSRPYYVSPYFVTYVVRRKSGELAAGITASKKIGGAVQRNRARRLVKAAIRQVIKRYDVPCDVVIVCRKAILDKKSTELVPILRAHLRKAGVIS